MKRLLRITVVFPMAALAVSALSAEEALKPEISPAELAEIAPALEAEETPGQAKAAECKKKICELASAAIHFASTHQGNLPATIEVLGLAATKTKNPIWSPFGPDQKSWGYEMRLRGVLLSGISDPAKTPLLAARFAGPDGKRWVAFADGHAEYLQKVPVVLLLEKRQPPGGASAVRVPER